MVVGKRLCLCKISLCPVVKVQCAVHVGMLDSLRVSTSVDGVDDVL